MTIAPRPQGWRSRRFFATIEGRLSSRRACSAVGSAPEWHSGGHRFDPGQVHYLRPCAVLQFCSNKAIHNSFQNIERGQRLFRQRLSIEPFGHLEPSALERLCVNLENGHLIGHNLGLVDDSSHGCRRRSRRVHFPTHRGEHGTRASNRRWGTVSLLSDSGMPIKTHEDPRRRRMVFILDGHAQYSIPSGRRFAPENARTGLRTPPAGESADPPKCAQP